VRTNLVLQSNTFNTTWITALATVTSGQTGYDGTNNAWLLSKSDANGRVNQNITLSSSIYTFSVYAKAGTDNWLFLRTEGAAGIHTAYFDLVNGAVGDTSLSTASITAVGNGYYRCSISFTDSLTIVRIYVADANNDTSGTSGNILIQAAQLEVGDIATDYIPTTTTAVSVGPVSNLPRLDYPINADGSVGCPSLLLEPQRTNVLTYSEQFDNAAWPTDGNGAGEIKTANYSISPDGYQDADRIQLNRTGGTYSRLRQDKIVAGAHTGSLYLKSNTGASQKIWMRLGGGVATKITITTSWQRFVVSAISSTSFELFIDNTDAEIATIADFSAWGAQLEAGAYATSYIPTLSTSVTRVADSYTRNNIYTNGFISASGGTWFLELADNVVLARDASGSEFYIGESAASSVQGGARSIAFRNVGGAGSRLTIQYWNGSALSDLFSTTSNAPKIAIKFNGTTADIFQNGVKVVSGASAALTLASVQHFNALAGVSRKLSQTLLFPTLLTDAQCIELTSL
jgi:hypothetical protein